MNLDDEYEQLGSAVGTGHADLPDLNVVGWERGEAQRARLREPRLYF